MTGPTYRLPNGEELDYHDRAMRIAQLRRDMLRHMDAIRQAESAIMWAEDQLAELHLAQRL